MGCAKCEETSRGGDFFDLKLREVEGQARLGFLYWREYCRSDYVCEICKKDASFMARHYSVLAVQKARLREKT